MKRAAITLGLTLMSLICLTNGSEAQDALAILYQDRAPYYQTNPDGSIGGVVGQPTYDAFNRAGIKTQWIKVPPNRQLETIRLRQKAVCSPGWFRNPEREEFAKFSAPVYQDSAQILVTSTRLADQINHDSLTSLFKDERYILGMKLGYSYGEAVDQKVAALHPSVMRTSQTVLGMIKMMLNNRFDYFISSPEEYKALVEQDPVLSGRLHVIHVKDFQAGLPRHLMCSMLVPDETIARFSQALSEIQ